jgi:hypothetical protein
MIEIKRCNYVTGETADVSFGLSKIVHFLETDGRNAILFCRPKIFGGQIRYFMDNKLEFSDFNEFCSLLENKSNIFRIDLLMFDFWHLNTFDIGTYQNEIDKLGIDYIIIAKSYHYKDSKSKDITDYHIKRESKDSGSTLGSMTFDSKYTITDNISGWSSDLDSLRLSYIRDKKIDGIIGE